MNINTIKQKSIISYLQDKGYKIDKRSSRNYTFFKSPFTNEKTASFAVNNRKNTFFDYSSGLSGDIIALVMLTEKINFKEAIKFLDDKKIIDIEVKQIKYAELIINDVLPLKDKWLLQYISINRKINLEIAINICKQIHYSVNERQYIAIGFENNSGGWELRNMYWKGSTSPKDITTIPKKLEKTNILNVFEGFIDYLSALTLYKTVQFKNDTLILNSCTFKNRIPFYPEYNMFVDNDKAGSEVISFLKQNNSLLNDKRELYKGYNDFNEYLCNIIL